LPGLQSLPLVSFSLPFLGAFFPLSLAGFHHFSFLANVAFLFFSESACEQGPTIELGSSCAFMCMALFKYKQKCTASEVSWSNFQIQSVKLITRQHFEESIPSLFCQTLCALWIDAGYYSRPLLPMVLNKLTANFSTWQNANHRSSLIAIFDITTSNSFLFPGLDPSNRLQKSY
jgi:hypothetical protein